MLEAQKTEEDRITFKVRLERQIRAREHQFGLIDLKKQELRNAMDDT